MKDRIPSPGKAGRVLVEPEGGGAPYYAVLRMADDPVEDGTALSKANLLSDETAQYLLLEEADPTPNDALRQIGWTRFDGYTNVEAGLPAEITPDPLSTLRSYMGCGTVGGKGIFAGGYATSSDTNAVEVYDPVTLVRTNPVTLSASRRPADGVPVGRYVLFPGQSYLDAIDEDLNRTNPTAPQGSVSTDSRGTHLNGKALIISTAGNLTAYDENLNRTVGQNVPFGTASAAMATVGGKAVVVQGTNAAYCGDDLVWVRMPNFPSSITNARGLSHGKYAMIHYGTTTSMWAYDEDLILHNCSPLSYVSRNSYSISSGSRAFWPMGIPSGSTTSNLVDVYDADLIKLDPLVLGRTGHSFGATQAGGYLVVAGGYGGATADQPKAYAFTALPTAKLAIPPMHSYKLTGMDEEGHTVPGTDYSYPGPVSGYVRPGGFVASGFEGGSAE